ncbi:GNAT family N-acetyltransferase [Roseibium sp. Sym1]|uniref:GNAT family N-acetyltransferase n=1 Tax=Roseibium sp. Sym1 TaxID=3016006 RepID=UPI0022B3BD6B|nr:GNAT family N-acetyltransferase [Roseibium sp. Sym1]
MSGYVGSPKQIALQKRAEDMYGWTMSTPGACNNARMLGSDDPDRLGFPTIRQYLQEDGIFGFRLLPKSDLGRLKEEMARSDARVDTWDVFCGDAEAVANTTAGILSSGLPSGFHEMPPLDGVEGARTRLFQEFIASAGIAPFSAGFLNGRFGKVVNVGLVDTDGALAACAHAYLPHNAHSPYHAWAWGGLVAVAPDHRGKGLGSIVNALMARAALDTLSATHVYELVSASNTASRKMVENSGLRLSSDLFSGLATCSEDRFTR